MSGRTWCIGVLSALSCCALAACGGAPQQQSGELTANTRLHIAQAAEANGDSDLAAAMYGAAGAGGASDATLQLKVADGLARNGKIALAEEALKQGLKANPGQPDLLRGLALVHVVSGKPEQAIVELDLVLAARPRDVRCTVDKAVALDLLRRHGEAQALYRQALALMPDDPEIRSNLALSMMLEGRLQEAEALLAPLKSSEVSSDRMRNNLGVIYAAIGDVGAARRLLGDSISAETLLSLTRAIPKSAATPADSP